MDLETFEDSRADPELLDGSHQLGRRSFLIGALATGAALAVPVNYAALARKRRIPLAKHAKFDQGVASGFPRRAGSSSGPGSARSSSTSKLKVVVAKDRKFGNVVEEKLVTAREDRDFTARTFVKGLKPDEQYFYRFVTKDSKSPVGRFKTAPPLDSSQNDPDRLLLLPALRGRLLQRPEGDRQRAGPRPGHLPRRLHLRILRRRRNGVRRDTSGNNHDGDTQLLTEYWQKYRLYKSDKDLQAMHAAHPFLSVWDDHEVEDNHADGQPSSAQTNPNLTQLKNYPRRVPFAQREANGQKAFFNYMPRVSLQGRPQPHLRGVPPRQAGRPAAHRRAPVPRPAALQRRAALSRCADGDRPARCSARGSSTGSCSSLKGSPATWKVWGTELMVMATRLGPGIPAQVDAWDGYGYERKRILDHILDSNIQNVVAITGDIHTFFAGTAYTTGDQVDRAGRHFPSSSAAPRPRMGCPESTGLSPGDARGPRGVNPHIKFYDFVKRGYGVIELGPSEAVCELKAVDARRTGRGDADNDRQVPGAARRPLAGADRLGRS